MATPSHGKTDISSSLVGRICTSIEGGNYVETACMAAGVTPSTYAYWVTQANEDEAAGEDTQFTDFKARIEQARAKAEQALLEKVKEGGKGWQAVAWVLERTRNDRFGQKQTITSTVELKAPDAPPNAPKTYKKWLERRQERSLKSAEEAEFIEVEDELKEEDRKREEDAVLDARDTPTRGRPPIPHRQPQQGETDPDQDGLDSSYPEVMKIPGVTKAQTSAHLLKKPK